MTVYTLRVGKEIYKVKTKEECDKLFKELKTKNPYKHIQVSVNY